VIGQNGRLGPGPLESSGAGLGVAPKAHLRQIGKLLRLHIFEGSRLQG